MTRKTLCIQLLVDVLKTKDHSHRKINSESLRSEYFLEFYLRAEKGRTRVCKKNVFDYTGIEWLECNNWAKSDIHGERNEEKKSTSRSKEKGKQCDYFCLKFQRFFLTVVDKVLFMNSLNHRGHQNFNFLKNTKSSVRIKTHISGPEKCDDVMEEIKVSIFSPKKDQRDICIAHKEANLTLNRWRIESTN